MITEQAEPRHATGARRGNHTNRRNIGGKSSTAAAPPVIDQLTLNDGTTLIFLNDGTTPVTRT